jgi:hypothetical protein
MPRKGKGGRNRLSKPAELPERYTPGCVLALDQRTALAQRLRDNFATIVQDIGGEAELSHIKASLIERFVHLEALLVQMEADLKRPGAPADIIGKWIQGTNALQGLAKVLGIERRTKDLWANVLTPPASPNGNGQAQPKDSPLGAVEVTA